MAKKPTIAGGFRAEIAAGILAAAVARVAAVVPTRNTMPIVAHALLRADGAGKLTVAATNLDQGLAVTVEAEAQGATTTPALKLAAIAARLDPGHLVTLHETDSGSLTVSSGRSTFKLPTLPAEDFPESCVAGPGEDALIWSVDGPTFAGHLKALEGSISSEEVRYYLNGIFMDLDCDAPALVATNGHTLGKADITAMAPPRHAGLILPRTALRPISEIAKAFGDVTIGLSVAAITVEGGSVRLRTKLIEGSFPDYRRVVPSHDQPNRVTVDAKEFATAIQRAMLVTPDPATGEEKKRKGKWSSMQVDIGDAEILFAARNSNGEEATDVCPCSRVLGEAVKIAASGIYLDWAIHSLGADTVDIALSDPTTPILIHATGDVTSLRVVMPQRR